MRRGVGPGTGVGRCRSSWWIEPSIQPEVAGPCSMATHPGGSGRGLRSRWQMALQAEVSGKGSGSIPTARPQANSSSTQAVKFVDNLCNARPTHWLALRSYAMATKELVAQSGQAFNQQENHDQGTTAWSTGARKRYQADQNAKYDQNELNYQNESISVPQHASNTHMGAE